MSETTPNPEAQPRADAVAVAPAEAAARPAAAVPQADPAAHRSTSVWLALLLLTALVLGLAWWFNGRLYSTQAEVARHLQRADASAIEVRTLSRQNGDALRDINARLAVLEAREQDLAAQRQQLQQIYQDFAKSRDDAVLGQLAELIALAQQQSQLSGSLTPLIGALGSAQHRLKQAGGPRAASVARAVDIDLARLRATVVPDIPAAAQRLDLLAASIDGLETVSTAVPPQGASAAAPQAPSRLPGWAQPWLRAAWEQLRQLVSITRVDHPDMLLSSPQQSDYLRANLKLRVLNARLDLLSRNAAAYRADMRQIQDALRADFNPRQAGLRVAETLAGQAAQVDLSAQPAANLQSLAVLSGLGVGGD